MKRAQAFKVLTCFREGDVTRHEVDEIDSVSNLLKNFWRNTFSSRRQVLPPLKWMSGLTK